MLDINIAPLNVRRKRKIGILGGGFKIPLEVVIGIGGGLIMLLVLVHFYLLFMNVSKLAKHQGLKNEWEDLLPAKENVDVVIKEMNALRDKNTAIAGISGEDDIVWSQKLNMLSDDMPQGVWLKKIAFNGEIVYIGGSAISRQKNELLNAHSLVANLKGDKPFLKGFEDIEMGSIQRRTLGKSKIADFLLTVKVK